MGIQECTLSVRVKKLKCQIRILKYGYEIWNSKMSYERIAARYTVETISQDHLNWFKMKGLKLAVREGNGKDKEYHYHMYIEGNLNVWRLYFKRHIGGGNAVFSIKKCQDDYVGYLRYMCKGEPEGSEPCVLFSDGYDIKKLQEEFVAVGKEMKDAAKLNSKRKRPTNVLDECWEYVQENCTCSSTQTGIGVAIMKWYYSHRMRLPNTASMSTMINTYIQWFNETAITPIPDDDLFRRLYPTLSG